jgi:hypothetical protein
VPGPPSAAARNTTPNTRANTPNTRDAEVPRPLVVSERERRLARASATAPMAER